MSLSDEDFVRHVLDEACNIAAFMKDKSIEDLRSNIMLDRAVTRSLEIMGEASKKVSKEYQKNIHPYPGAKCRTPETVSSIFISA